MAGRTHASWESASVPNSVRISANAVWFLVGPLDSGETTRYLPIYTVPYVIGRRDDLALTLSYPTVSSMHAEITTSDGALILRDLKSTNGTYVNGQRVTEPVVLGRDDLVQFANVAFRVRQQAAHGETHTVQENACDRALALVQFDKLMAERAVTPFFQPIVSMTNFDVLSYEILARSRLFGLEMPKDMFEVATQLNLEVELSCMLRFEGLAASHSLPGTPHVFVNTHPRELAQPGLLESLETLRKSYPEPRITVEIHEAAVTDLAQMAQLRAAMKGLGMTIAYDDFGAGQSRLNELSESPPDYLKFDMSLIRDINAASAQRQQVLAALVAMARDLGVIPLAEGVETQAESDTCAAMGFQLGQGYFYGRPAPARDFPRAG
jgi:EAL domain-containing protein (putative c-di-GMP-specific phosphodiesterase class I)